MNKHRRIVMMLVTALAGIAGIAAVASMALAVSSDRRELNGTIWVANRSANTIRGFDAATGQVVHTWPMAPGSQPGDLAFAKGKLYVSEEFGTAPALAVVDPESGDVLKRFFAAGITDRPHHVHASRGGRLVSFGLYGTDMVGVVDTRTDTLLGPWDTNPDTTNGRAHAGVFSPDGNTLYVASDATSELIALDPRTGELLWRLNVPNAHELAITRDGKTAYVSARTGNAIRIVDLERRLVSASFALGPTPDTLQLSPNDKLLTVGLRGTPAQVAVVDTQTLDYEIVKIGPPGNTTTIAGHQWTSSNGHFTFAAFEGPGAGVAVIDHTQGNAVVQTLDYPGRPHGVTFARPLDESDDD
jgi:DNA-binding beta-propeller fold protein YncE